MSEEQMSEEQKMAVWHIGDSLTDIAMPARARIGWDPGISVGAIQLFDRLLTPDEHEAALKWIRDRTPIVPPSE